MSLSIKAMKLSHRVTKSPSHRVTESPSHQVTESPSRRVTESPSRDVTYYTDENKHDVIGASFIVMELWSYGVVELGSTP